jgi:hypothetical protein
MLCHVTRALEHTSLSSCTFFAVPDVSEEGSESLLHSYCPHLHLLQLQLSKLREGGPLHFLHWLNCRQRQRSQMPKWAYLHSLQCRTALLPQRSQLSHRTELFSLFSAHKCRIGQRSVASALTSTEQEEALRPQRSQVPDRAELFSLSAHKCRSGRSSLASALTSARQDGAL